MVKKEKLLFLIIAIILLVIIAGSFYFIKWIDGKAYKISIGLCEPMFPYRDRTEAELARLFPQVKYADVVTRVTPEETYAQFREGLRTNNLGMVLDQLDKNAGQYKENVEAVKKAYNESRFLSIYKSYPEKLEKDWEGDTIASYYFLKNIDSEAISQSIDFAKDKNGDWKMKSL